MPEKEKPRTTDEYVLNELEKAKNLTKAQQIKIANLEAELAKKIPIPEEPTIAESPYKCYSCHVLSQYSSDWDKLNDPLTTDQMQELLDNDLKFRAWAISATYKDYVSSKSPVLHIYETTYQFEINYFGVLIGVGITAYNDKTIQANTYVKDDRSYYSDRETCLEAGYKELKENLEYILKRRREKEAEEAKKLAEAADEPKE